MLYSETLRKQCFESIIDRTTFWAILTC